MKKQVIIAVVVTAVTVTLVCLIMMSIVTGRAAQRELDMKIAKQSEAFKAEQEEFMRDSNLKDLLADYKRLLNKQGRTPEDYKRLGRIEARLRSIWTEKELADVRHSMGF